MPSLIFVRLHSLSSQACLSETEMHPRQIRTWSAEKDHGISAEPWTSSPCPWRIPSSISHQDGWGGRSSFVLSGLVVANLKTCDGRLSGGTGRWTPPLRGAGRMGGSRERARGEGRKEEEVRAGGGGKVISQHGEKENSRTQCHTLQPHHLLHCPPSQAKWLLEDPPS